MSDREHLRLPATRDVGSREVELGVELDRLCDQWSRLSRRHQDLCSELSRFRCQYHRAVGPLYLELDRVELRLLELRTAIEIIRRVPNLSAEECRAWVDVRMKDHKKRVARLEEELDNSRRRAEEEASREDLTPEQRKLMRKLYRRLAKAFHPDMQVTAESQRECEVIMARINQLYTAGDLEGLELIAAQERLVVRYVFASGEDYWNWLESRVARLKARIEDLERRVDELSSCDLAVLRRRVADAEQEGRDLLKEMAADLETKVAAKRQELWDMQLRVEQGDRAVRERLRWYLEKGR